MKTELLAPGGSVEGIRAALAAGADAVYTGGALFGARAYARNLDQKELQEAIDYCHLHGRKLYLTVNTLLKEEEITKRLYDFLLPLYRHGLDAVLVQDLGVLRLIRREFPDLNIHASTQMSVQSVQGASFLQRMGLTRIVPARELSLEEIRAIHDQCPIEIETFIHGALCYCYSGQCLLSSLIGGRSGNRGRCAQPCRQRYRLENEKGVLESKNGPYLLSLKDICTLDLLPDLVEAGICSFKIEGRMKSPAYAAGVTEVYRRALDLYSKTGKEGYSVPEEDRRMLMDLFNRGGFSAGYYQCGHGRDMMSMKRPSHAGTAAVRVKRSDGRTLTGTALEELWAGDSLLAGKDAGGDDLQVTVDQHVASGKTFSLKLPDFTRRTGSGTGNKKAFRFREGQILQRVHCTKLLEDLEKRWMQVELCEKIKGKFILTTGQPAILELSATAPLPAIGQSEGALSRPAAGQAITAVCTGDVPECARSEGLKEADIRRQLEKTGGTPFVFEELEIVLDDHLFMPVSRMNQLRREALAVLEQKLLSSRRRETPLHAEKAGGAQTDGGIQAAGEARQQETELPAYEAQRVRRPAVYCAVYTPQQLEALLDIDETGVFFLDSLYYMDHPGASWEEDAGKVHRSGRKAVLMLPPLWRSRVQDVFSRVFTDRWQEVFDGCLLRCLDQLGMTDVLHRVTCLTDTGIYVWNREAAAFLMEAGVKHFACPAELNADELGLLDHTFTSCMVYGYQPAMITAQCLQENVGGCTKKPSVLKLTDRKDMVFPVRTHCSICCNVIYNSAPLDLSGYSRKVAKLGCEALMLSFTTEDAAQACCTARRVLGAFFGENVTDTRKVPTTNGHFMRGVE